MDTEQDMGKLREVFDYALNTIAGATQIAKDLETLKGQVEALSHEVGSLRDTNRWMDEQITELRQQRDAARADAASALATITELQTDNDILQSKLSDAVFQQDTIWKQVEQARKERDDALFENMRLHEENEALKAKLRAIEEALHPEPSPTPSWPPVQAISG